MKPVEGLASTTKRLVDGASAVIDIYVMSCKNLFGGYASSVFAVATGPRAVKAAGLLADACREGDDTHGPASLLTARPAATVALPVRRSLSQVSTTWHSSMGSYRFRTLLHRHHVRIQATGT